MAEVNNLTSLLRRLALSVTGEAVTIGAVLGILGPRTYGPVLTLLGVVAISPLTIVPGLSWAMAFATLLIAVQIFFGRRYPWLPKRFLEIQFKQQAFSQALEETEKYASFIDRFLKPRLLFITYPPFIQVFSLACIGAALITFPLGFIPFGPVLPSITVLLFGLGLTARDGFFVLGGVACFAASVWVLYKLGNLLPAI